MLSGLGNPEACFLSGIKSFFIKHRGYNDLQGAAEGGHDATAYLYAILLYRDNGGAAADDTAKGYMRRVAGGGSMTSSRWLSNQARGVCLRVRRPRARSTTRLGAFGVNRCRLQHRCVVISRAQAPAVAAAWKKDGFKFLYFAVKIVGCVAKW
jgi:hypothetical protein